MRSCLPNRRTRSCEQCSVSHVSKKGSDNYANFAGTTHVEDEIGVT
jgi:hypothetical protein